MLVKNKRAGYTTADSQSWRSVGAAGGSWWFDTSLSYTVSSKPVLTTVKPISKTDIKHIYDAKGTKETQSLEDIPPDVTPS